MKGALRIVALTLGIAASSVIMTPAQAHLFDQGGMEYLDPVTGANVYVGSGMSYFGSYYNTVCGHNCINVPAHHFNGHHYKAQTVCYKGGYYNASRLCGRVHGYWHHKTWIPGHAICWKYQCYK